MKAVLPVCLCLALSLTANAQPFQVLFECQTPGPFPILPLVDCDGVGAIASSSLNTPPTVVTSVSCGLPIAGGQQFAYIPAGGDSSGLLTIPPGGPFPRPISPFVNEIQIGIPAGATTVTFFWEFYDGEGGYFGYNDAFEVSVVDPATGLAIGNPLAYMDVYTMSQGVSTGTCMDAGPGAVGFELGAPLGVNNAPQIFSGPLPSSLPIGAYLSVVCSNGLDNSIGSAAAIDEVIFGTNPVCSFIVQQPLGPGSLAFEVLNCNPGETYVMPLTLQPGTFPNGWAFGIDIPIGALLAEIAFGPPFFGTLDALGNATWAVPAGIPPGLTLYAGCGLFAPGGGTLSQVFTPVNLITL